MITVTNILNGLKIMYGIAFVARNNFYIAIDRTNNAIVFDKDGNELKNLPNGYEMVYMKPNLVRNIIPYKKIRYSNGCVLISKQDMVNVERNLMIFKVLTND